MLVTLRMVPSLTLSSNCSRTVLRSRPWDMETALQIRSSDGRCFCFFTFLMASRIHWVYIGLASFTMAAVWQAAGAQGPYRNDRTQKIRTVGQGKHLACAVAPPPPPLSLIPLSAYYPLSWGRTESASEAENEQHGREQLTIAQTP